MVLTKGTSDSRAIHLFDQFLCECGLTGRIALRSDGEPALIEVMRAVAKLRAPMETIVGRTPPGSSSPSDAVSCYSRTAQADIRLWKMVVEKKWNINVTTTSAILPWIVMHSAWLRNRYHVFDVDHQTAYERLHGHVYQGPVFQFTDVVMIKCPRERWAEGIWLGKSDVADEPIVGTTIGIQLGRTCRWLLPSEGHEDIFQRMRFTHGFKILERCKMTGEERAQPKPTRQTTSGRDMLPLPLTLSRLRAESCPAADLQQVYTGVRRVQAQWKHSSSSPNHRLLHPQ